MYIIKEISENFVWKELKDFYYSNGKNLISDKAIEYFKKFIPKKSIVLYLGINFPDSISAKTVLKKFKINQMKKNIKLNFTTSLMKAWSINVNDAKESIGMNSSLYMKDPDTFGVLLKIKIKESDIAAPVAFLSKEKVKKIGNYQNDIILKPGSYTPEVIDFYGNWIK